MARPSEFPVKKLLALTPETAKAIDDYRFTHRIKTEAEALRRLIEAGLNTAVSAGSGDKPPGAQGKGFPPITLGRSGSDKQPASKPAAPSPRKPRAQSAAMSKEAQIRALREQGAER